MSKKVDFFDHVSTFQGDVPETLQKVFWDRAVKSKNIDLLATLASRPSISEYVREQASLRKDIKVKVSFLSRSDVSNDMRLSYLSSETRAGVYAGLIDNAGALLNDKIFNKVDTVFSAKKTVSLAECLINSSHSPNYLLVKCLSFISNNSSSFKSDEFARTFSTKLRTAASDKDCFGMLLEEFSVENKFFPTVFDWNSPGFDSSFATIISKYSGKIKETLQKLLDLADKNHVYYLRRYQTTPAPVVLSGLVTKILNNNPSESLASFLKTNTRLHSHLDETTRELVVSFDPEASLIESKRLENLRYQAVSESSETAIWALLHESDEEIFDNLMRNPYLSEILVLEMFTQLVNSGAEPSRIYNFLKSYPYESVMILGYFAHPSEFVRLDNWEFFQDVAKAKREIFALFAPNNAQTNPFSRYRSYGIYNLSYLIESLSDSDPALLDIPWEVYSSTFRGWSRFETSKITNMLLQYQTEKFGDNQDLWDSFNVISQNYQGSLKDLVDTVTHM